VLPAGFSGNQHALVTALHNRFEVVSEARETRERIGQCGKRSVPGLKSLDLLQYNLRTLLHRNDAMGMSASIEARFPYLDSNFVRTSVNLPARSKIRFSPTYLDRRHYFFMDKWLLRQVATRYLPRELSHRLKLGFPVNAADRMVIDPRLFDGGNVLELFGITPGAMRYLLDEARQPLKVRLLQLEVWSSLFLRNIAIDAVRENVTRWVKVAAVLLVLASLSAAPGVRIRTPRTGRGAMNPAPVTAAATVSQEPQI
jgi:asparagine synthase (glutamine-hydrolysing)